MWKKFKNRVGNISNKGMFFFGLFLVVIALINVIICIFTKNRDLMVYYILMLCVAGVFSYSYFFRAGMKADNIKKKAVEVKDKSQSAMNDLAQKIGNMPKDILNEDIKTGLDILEDRHIANEYKAIDAAEDNIKSDAAKDALDIINENQETDTVVKSHIRTNYAYNMINATEAKKIMDNELGYLLIDVRTIEEYGRGHIPRAINIPVEDVLADKIDGLMDNEQLLLIYCNSGNRSKDAAFHLSKLGYTNIYEFGGIIDWPFELE